MNTYLFLAIILLAANLANAADLTIFDVRRSLPMANDEKAYRDFYINGGTESGVQQGMVITIQRRTPLYDNYQNRSAGDLDVRVAKIKVIHVQRGLAVARLHSEFSRDNAPLLEDNFIMVGDRLDLGSATYDKSDKEKEKGKKAESAEQNEPVASANGPDGQILINSVELSSESPNPVPPTPNAPAIETSTLQ